MTGSVLVTGATDGIGEEIARQLVERGIGVIVHGRTAGEGAGRGGAGRGGGDRGGGSGVVQPGAGDGRAPSRARWAGS